MRARSLRESKVEAERMMLATRSALPADGDLLSAARARRRSKPCSTTCSAPRRATITTPIDAAVEALAKGTEAFAAERMNRGIRQALSGRSIEEV